MQYFKNNELAESQHVSLKTILNWIDSAKKGKLDLTLHSVGDRSYVANTVHNMAIVERLAQEGRKYRNKRGAKTIVPKETFYEVYDDRQILDMVLALSAHKELPEQYDYFDTGITYWDEYVTQLSHDNNPNGLTYDWQLLKINQAYLDRLVAHYDRINIVDIGVGNAMPVRPLITHLLEKGIMGTYIGIDINLGMLELARNNLVKWFGSKFSFKGYVRDINYDRCAEIIAAESASGSERVCNLVTVFGSTLNNLRSPQAALRLIHDSMGEDDILAYSVKLDSAASRRYFDFNPSSNGSGLSWGKRLLDLLNLDESYYDVEMGFDQQLNQRYIRIRLKVALTIDFMLGGNSRPVELNKGDAILILRIRHQGAMEVMQELAGSGFAVMQMSLPESREHILTFSRIRPEQ